MVGRVIAPKEIHVLIPATCYYLSLHGKRDFAEVVKLRTFKWDYPEYFGGGDCPNMLTMGLYKGKRAAGELVRDGEVIMEPAIRVMWLLTEDHKPRNLEASRKWKRQENGLSSRVFSRNSILLTSWS